MSDLLAFLHVGTHAALVAVLLAVALLTPRLLRDILTTPRDFETGGE